MQSITINGDPEYSIGAFWATHELRRIWSLREDVYGRLGADVAARAEAALLILYGMGYSSGIAPDDSYREGAPRGAVEAAQLFAYEIGRLRDLGRANPRGVFTV